MTRLTSALTVTLVTSLATGLGCKANGSHDPGMVYEFENVSAVWLVVNFAESRLSLSASRLTTFYLPPI